MALDSRQIAVAALDLVEAHGAESLTMKSLSAALDRQPSSLYNHISGRGDLIERMRAIIVEDIDTTSFSDKCWDEALIDWGRSYLAAFAARPRSIRLLATTPITDPSTLQMYDVVITSLTGAGWADGDALAVMRTVEAHVLGSALDVVAPGTLLSAEAVPASLRGLHSALAPEHSDTSSARAAFELGIHALIDGLRSRMPAAVSGSEGHPNRG